MATTRRTVHPLLEKQPERITIMQYIRRILIRPEMGAIVGAIAVWVFFAVVAGDRGFLSLSGTATYLAVAAELGILAVAAALLMIGGEFDLSIGSVSGACSMIVTICSVEFGLDIWSSIAIALLVSLLIGFLNGILVLRTGLSSFIVTLASLFVVRGATIGFTRLLTGRTQLGGLEAVPGYDLAHSIFASGIMLGGASFPISIVWWLVLAALATWLLLGTRFGNWIYGVGGDAQASRNMGVPVARVKIILFMLTALAACLVGIIQTVTFTGADVLRGSNNEFLTIIAVVVGGTLLTGGYGSAIGSVFGALIFGMVRQGIVFAGVDADWYQVFLGVMLLLAVILNRFVRTYAMEARR
ncbi:monosaccharide ABC transporter membrane protein (CUT2 family) [Thermosporothrix hazakensis]|uniref:Xylose transport system permease protein XylH n=2 Tax=Thermosporothrix TaxID=768650 RepID=A0A326U7X6_THEHA|nr:ABC transporter permease [Thermosporothrix hazakensis]PZW29285.1 monosaccharide ABC transporter membrane protein (CUT2 family) [Thermosporothrix hazakensis]BBH86216.1 sugar ABC transporter permease [Thermosporothrix sp. COM3]GCE45362.1 sugar ABC transporter permease [Thermosporothrix hazakensis]